MKNDVKKIYHVLRSAPMAIIAGAVYRALKGLIGRVEVESQLAKGLPVNFFRSLMIAMVCLPAVVGRAQVVDNWTSTTSGLWGLAGNWNSGVPTSTSIATFNNSAGLTTSINLPSVATVNSLVFNSTGGAHAYTFDTAGNVNVNTLTVAAGITNSDSAALTFYNTTTLAGSQAWTNKAERRFSTAT